MSLKTCWRWHSQQGSERLENRDAAGLFATNEYIFAVVMDAAHKGTHGQQFNAIWMQELMRLLPEWLPTDSEVFGAMHASQQQLRQARLFEERACYAALLLPFGAKSATAYICGDCRVGVEDGEGNARWLTPVHTLDAACQRLATQDCTDDARRTVTRTLNGKRFERPQVVEVNALNSDTWLLATDGHWNNSLTDDSSCLALGPSMSGKRQAEVQNLIIGGRFAQS